MKALNIFFIILFVFSAALQYNDPDPYLWMPIYLYGAVLCAFALVKRVNPYLHVVGIGAYFAYAGILFFSETGVLSWVNDHGAESIAATMQAEKPWIEETREFFGLLLLISALSTNLIVSYLTKRKATQLTA